MSLIHHILAYLPGKTGRRYKKKLIRARIIGSDERFLKAIHNCKLKKIAIDLGANRGQYTNILVENFDRVIAYEPNPDAFTVLEKNLIHNSNIELHQKAAGIENHTAIMFLLNDYQLNPESLSEGNSFFKSKENIDHNKYISVEVIDIIRFIEDLNQEIGIIKIDIEGAEIPVLESLLNSPSLQRIEYIFVETHEFKIPELYKRTVALRKRAEKLEKPRIDMNWG